MVSTKRISDRAKRPLAAASLITLMALTLTIGSGQASSGRGCEEVEGTLVEREVTPAPALRTTGRLKGDIKGKYDFTLERVEPTDPSTATVLLFVGKSVVDTDAGDLFFTESGALDTVGKGNLSDLATITGGTGKWARATGQIHIFGFYSQGRGRSEYTGTVCNAGNDNDDDE